MVPAIPDSARDDGSVLSLGRVQKIEHRLEGKITMENSNLKKRSMKIGILLFYLSLLIAGIMVFSTIRSAGFDRLTSAKLLRRIQANALAYRLAEMETVLSSEGRQKEEYIGRMESISRQLERNQREFETLLATEAEQAAYVVFSSDWKAYLNESNAMQALSKSNLDRQDISVLTKHSRMLYDKSSRSLDTLIEANAKAPQSWSDFIKVFYRKNRLALTFLYICGVTALLILIFNGYDKIKRRKSHDQPRR